MSKKNQANETHFTLDVGKEEKKSFPVIESVLLGDVIASIRQIVFGQEDICIGLPCYVNLTLNNMYLRFAKKCLDCFVSRKIEMKLSIVAFKTEIVDVFK